MRDLGFRNNAQNRKALVLAAARVNETEEGIRKQFLPEGKVHLLYWRCQKYGVQGLANGYIEAHDNRNQALRESVVVEQLLGSCLKAAEKLFCESKTCLSVNLHAPAFIFAGFRVKQRRTIVQTKGRKHNNTTKAPHEYVDYTFDEGILLPAANTTVVGASYLMEESDYNPDDVSSINGFTIDRNCPREGKRWIHFFEGRWERAKGNLIELVDHKELLLLSSKLGPDDVQEEKIGKPIYVLRTKSLLDVDRAIEKDSMNDGSTPGRVNPEKDLHMDDKKTRAPFPDGEKKSVAEEGDIMDECPPDSTPAYITAEGVAEPEKRGNSNEKEIQEPQKHPVDTLTTPDHPKKHPVNASLHDRTYLIPLKANAGNLLEREEWLYPLSNLFPFFNLGPAAEDLLTKLNGPQGYLNKKESNAFSAEDLPLENQPAEECALAADPGSPLPPNAFIPADIDELRQQFKLKDTEFWYCLDLSRKLSYPIFESDSPPAWIYFTRRRNFIPAIKRKQRIDVYVELCRWFLCTIMKALLPKLRKLLPRAKMERLELKKALLPKLLKLLPRAKMERLELKKALLPKLLKLLLRAKMERLELKKALLPKLRKLLPRAKMERLELKKALLPKLLKLLLRAKMERLELKKALLPKLLKLLPRAKMERLELKKALLPKLLNAAEAAEVAAEGEDGAARAEEGAAAEAAEVAAEGEDGAARAEEALLPKLRKLLLRAKMERLELKKALLPKLRKLLPRAKMERLELKKALLPKLRKLLLRAKMERLELKKALLPKLLKLLPRAKMERLELKKALLPKLLKLLPRAKMERLELKKALLPKLLKLLLRAKMERLELKKALLPKLRKAEEALLPKLRKLLPRAKMERLELKKALLPKLRKLLPRAKMERLELKKALLPKLRKLLPRAKMERLELKKALLPKLRKLLPRAKMERLELKNRCGEVNHLFRFAAQTVDSLQWRFALRATLSYYTIQTRKDYANVLQGGTNEKQKKMPSKSNYRDDSNGPHSSICRTKSVNALAIP
eukprot:gene38-19_t